MKYRLAGASYRTIAEKLTEERAQAYADEHGVSFERAMRKITHVSESCERAGCVAGAGLGRTDRRELKGVSAGDDDPRARVLGGAGRR